jgi:hypothetical protein
MKHGNERHVARTKKMTAIGVLQNALHFKAQAAEIRANGLPRFLRSDINHNSGLRARETGGRKKQRSNYMNPYAAAHDAKW